MSLFSDPAAEIRLLAAFIDNPKSALSVKEKLFTEDRVSLFKAMRQCFEDLGEISFEGVQVRYDRPVPPDLEIARGAKPAGLIEYLTRLATRRELLQKSNDLTVLLSKPDISNEEIAALMQFTPITTEKDSSLYDGIAEFTSDLRRKKAGKYRYVDTGLPFLNVMLGNEWPRQALTIIIGSPGGGKTALLCHSSLNMARMGIPSLVISLEMSKARLVSRYIANMANVDGLALRSGNISAEEEARVAEALEEFQSLPIYIIDNPMMSVSDIVYQVKKHKELYGIEAFFVDYLQIITSENYDDEFMQLGRNTQALRNVAKMEDISAVVLAQQNRQFKGLQSISGSSKVGQIADTVFEICLEDGGTDDKRTCVLDFHKNRDGPVGNSVASYRPRYLRFE